MIQFFFDDDGLFSRVNTVRKYGNPELIKDAVYYDGLCSTDYCTCDVFKTDDGIIHIGIAKPLAGYSHDDCNPFSGDSADWVPTFKNGKNLNDLAGKTIVLEISFLDGELYSLRGNFTPVFNTQAARYRRFGLVPDGEHIF